MDNQIDKEIINKINPSIRITFSLDDKFFGPGINSLLHSIEENGSIQSACKSMKMSYSKAWTIIRRMEKHLGCKVLDTKIGGVGGGVSVLTDAAKDFLDKYDKMYKELNTLTQQSFDKYFK